MDFSYVKTAKDLTTVAEINGYLKNLVLNNIINENYLGDTINYYLKKFECSETKFEELFDKDDLYIFFQLFYFYSMQNHVNQELLNSFIIFLYRFRFNITEKELKIRMMQIIEKLTIKYKNINNEIILKLCEYCINYSYLKFFTSKILKNIESDQIKKFVCKNYHFEFFLLRRLYNDDKSACEDKITNIIIKINDYVFESETTKLISFYDFNKNIKYFPNKFSSIGYRNLTKIFKIINDYQKSDILQGSNVILKFLLDKNYNKEINFHFCEYLRIENFKRINQITDLYDFIFYNQFFDNTGLRAEYIKNFRIFFENYNDNTNVHLEKLNILIFKMCKSTVKIRKELGVSFLSILIDLKLIALDSSAIKEIIELLIFDSYEELRNIVYKYVNLDSYDISFLIRNLKNFEYCVIYPSVDIIIQKDCKIPLFKVEFDRIFEFYITNNYMQIVQNPIYGFLVLYNKKNIKIDAKIKFLYNYCMNFMSVFFSNTKTDFNLKIISKNNEDDKTYETIIWRTLKEISVYYGNKIKSLDEIHYLEKIMFKINHLGIYTHIYNILIEKFKTIKCEESEIYLKLNKIFQEIEKNDFELSRKGAGVCLLILSFTSIERFKNSIINFLINTLTKKIVKLEKKDAKVIYLNILIKLVNSLQNINEHENCISKLTQFAFELSNSEEWEIKNAVIILFSNIVSKIFGKNAWNRNCKKDVINDNFRNEIYNTIIKTNNDNIIYMILLVYDRLTILDENEIEIIKKYIKHKGLIRLKARKILKEKLEKIQLDFYDRSSINLDYLDILCEKERLICLFKLLNIDDKNTRDAACFYMQKIGFKNESDEVLKHRIFQYFKNTGQLNLLVNSLKKPEKLESKVKCFLAENSNCYYDFEYLIDIVNFYKDLKN